MKKPLIFSFLCIITEVFSLGSLLLMLIPGITKIATGNTQNSPLLADVNIYITIIVSIIMLALFAFTSTLCTKHIIAFSQGKVVSTDIILVILLYLMFIVSFFLPNELTKSYPLYNHIWITQGITAFIYKLSVYGIGIYQIGIIFTAFFATMSISQKREKYAF